MEKLRWGILGTGAIAHAFAHGLSQSEHGLLAAVGSRSAENAERFGEEFGVASRHASYEAAIEDPTVDAIYVSVPNPFHASWAVRAAQAGKHVLGEKPSAMNHGQTMAIVEAARESGVLYMEAFMYRCHPQTARLVELLRDRVIGDVRMIRAAFGFGGGSTINRDGRLFRTDLGGGGIMDVGCYPVSMSRLVAGVAASGGAANRGGADGAGAGVAEPVEVAAAGHRGETGIDEWAAAVLRFESGIVAQVSTAVRASLDNSLEIYGSGGRITVPNPWVANRRDADPGRIVVTANGETVVHDIAADRTSFAYEADLLARTIAEGRREAAFPAMSHADSLGNIAVLDRWRGAVGVVFPADTEEGNVPVRGTLARRADAKMEYGRIPGLEKPVSRMIFGCDNQQTFAHGAAVWDDWFERGGNAFDTSWVYGGGTQEKLLGKWIRARGVRADAVVTVKGAHTPRCLPDLLVQDFHTSLDRLGFEFADIYVMHRDNPDVPAGEFVDVLNELVDAGLIRGALGGSNWTVERFVEVNEYARANGKQGMAILNNNLSLARMVKPVWNGCVHLSDTGSRRWLEETGTTNFSWSSQARGYFLPESERLKLGQANFECWDAPDNRARRGRAEVLATSRGCSPINIAAAYVLRQPFPSFALVGPRTIHETATTIPALDVRLTREEIDWLWGDDA